MIKELDLNENKVLKEVYELQRASYLIEAQLINFFEIPPLNESIEDLQNCNETFFGYYQEEELAGAISYTIDDHILTICRMVVHPDHFRKGIAQKLLVKVEENDPYISVFKVSTGKDNHPAKNLYLKNGYQLVTDLKVAPDLFISQFIKEKTPSYSVRTRTSECTF